jgi:hypothetical protein
MTNKLRSAIIGGVVIGLLSGIPYLNLVNVFCCLWIIVGGALASYLYIKKSSVPVNIGEGAMIGALAGAIGMMVQLLVGVPLTILAGYPELNFLVSIMERLDPQKAEIYRQRVEHILSRPFSEQFFSSVFSLGTLLNLLITVVFAMIGGLIAIPLFEKRKADILPPPPPPPPYYGSTPGGDYSPPPPADTYGPNA